MGHFARDSFSLLLRDEYYTPLHGTFVRVGVAPISERLHGHSRCWPCRERGWLEKLALVFLPTFAYLTKGMSVRTVQPGVCYVKAEPHCVFAPNARASASTLPSFNDRVIVSSEFGVSKRTRPKCAALGATRPWKRLSPIRTSQTITWF